LNPKQIKNKNLEPDEYFGEDIYEPPSNGYIAATLAISLILNFIPFHEDIAVFRPDFVVIVIIYWAVNYPHKMGMSIAFCTGLMMDVANAGILGQHALAYCIAVYLTLILGRRLRIFSLVQQAPQVGFILLVMQIVIALVAASGGTDLPAWPYYFAAVTGSLLWLPVSLMLRAPLRQRSDPNAL